MEALKPPGYARHRPESTLLYQLVEQHYPAFREMRAEVGRPLPDFVEEEFEADLKCGRLEQGFRRLRCEHCHAERLVVTPAKRGVGATAPADRSGEAQQPVTPRHVAMNWARRLKRVFGVEVEGCARCGGTRAEDSSSRDSPCWQSASPPGLLIPARRCQAAAGHKARSLKLTWVGKVD